MKIILKKILKVLVTSLLPNAAYDKSRSKFSNGVARAVNYHKINKSSYINFNKQLAYFKKNYSNCTEKDLESIIKGCDFQNKPRLIVSFDDGDVSNYYAAEILEHYGFTGWFFLPTSFLSDSSVAPSELSSLSKLDEFMSIDMVKDLISRGHIVGCHTSTHSRLPGGLKKNVYLSEILGSFNEFYESLGFKPSAFAWVGGEYRSYSTEAYRVLLLSEYKYVFMTNNSLITQGSDRYMLDRTNIESDWSIRDVILYTSGIWDFLYLIKRIMLKSFILLK